MKKISVKTSVRYLVVIFFFHESAIPFDLIRGINSPVATRRAGGPSTTNLSRLAVP